MFRPRKYLMALALYKLRLCLVRGKQTEGQPVSWFIISDEGLKVNILIGITSHTPPEKSHTTYRIFVGPLCLEVAWVTEPRWCIYGPTEDKVEV